MNISQSKKRATIMFNLPGYSRVTVQEAEDKPDQKLRNAIEVARKAFWDAWHPEPEEKR